MSILNDLPRDPSADNPRWRDPGTAVQRLSFALRHPLFPVIVVFGLLLCALQWAGGAWTAEFDGYTDEAAQFLTGRMVWEYLHHWPPAPPIAWAGQYYLHYPKIGMGHWPPGYHLAEAAWSFVFGSSRMSAMWLQWLLGLFALTVLFRSLRGHLPTRTLWGILLLITATPVFQRALEQTMSELASLLCAAVFTGSLLRLQQGRDRTAAILLLVSFLAAALVKGTAIYLAPVPLLLWLLSRNRIPLRISPRIFAGTIVTLAICLGWFVSTINIRYWGGITFYMPWSIETLVALTGAGFLLLALPGISREPVALTAACMVGSAVAVSFVVRSINEPRHWVMILPSIFVLCSCTLQRFPRTGILLLLPALVLFPWMWYRQSPGGYNDLAQRVKLPARMLISSGTQGEGGWITEVALRERYPASFIARASKVLANSGWNGESYRLLTPLPGDVLRRLDELAIDLVIVDTPGNRKWPHHAILESAMEHDASWQLCQPPGRQLVYCRVKPPHFPRRPLILDAGGYRLEEDIAPIR